MAREVNKPFTRTEMKILVYNKINEGYTYEEAKRIVKEEIDFCIQSNKNEKQRKKKDKIKSIKEDFKKLKNERKR